MLTIGQLFRRRVLSDWRYQIKSIRTAIDWMVIVYLVIPLMIIGGYHYTVWWQSAPAWFERIDYSYFLILLVVFAWSGTIRWFVEEGDQLFLRQNTSWFNRHMVFGWRYSLVLQLITTALLIALFLPLLRNTFSLGSEQILCLFVLTYLFKINVGLTRQILAIQLSGFRLWIARLGVIAASFMIYRVPVWEIPQTTIWGWMVCLLLLGLIPVLSRIRFKIKGAFFADVARENDSRMRITAWMLIRVVRKQKPKRLKQRPFFYGNSTRIFRGKGADVGLSELLVKSYIRSGTQWRLGIQFVVLLSAVLLLLPSGIQVIAWLVAALLLTLWRKAYCKDALTAPFLKMFPVKDEDKHQALRKATPLLALPAFLLISLCFGFTLMVWWGPLLMLAAAIPVVYFFSTIVTSWY